MTRTAAAVFLLSYGVVFGQNPADRPEFEVASVKPAKPPVDGRLMVGMSTDPGRIHMTNVSLRDFIHSAYDLKEYQISGPDWINSERYDITATVPPGTSKEKVRLMSQNLLADRFKLVAHRDQKVLPVYALVAGKGGFKIKPAEGGGAGGRGMARFSPGRLELQKTTLTAFADTLSHFLERPVVDQTKIEGSYDFSLEWTPDESQMQQMRLAIRDHGPGPGRGGAGNVEPAPTDIEGPSIFAAIEEKLGLKLEARNLAVEVLVIDHAEKVPTEN